MLKIFDWCEDVQVLSMAVRVLGQGNAPSLAFNKCKCFLYYPRVTFLFASIASQLKALFLAKCAQDQLWQVTKAEKVDEIKLDLETKVDFVMMLENKRQE